LQTINQIARFIFFQCLVRPLIFIVVGANVRHRERLPKVGPAILVANHNSHLDTLLLMSLFPRRVQNQLRPVAAADYFLKSRFLTWLSLQVIQIIPIKRSGTTQGGQRTNPLAEVSEVLKKNEIVIFFPEGTRGEPEKRIQFKSGIAALARVHPEVPVVPICLRGLGKVLPRGEALLVPFFCDVFVGDALRWTGTKESFMTLLSSKMDELESEGHQSEWT